MDNTLPTEITLLTLNVWGLKFISEQRNERLLEIGRQLSLAEPGPDVVALQECFCQEDFQAIRQQLLTQLPFAKFYYSGAFGSGLAILSRWPMEQSTMIPYPMNGRPTAFWRGDWYVGKGIAHARIRIGSRSVESGSSSIPPCRRILEVFNTHTHSPYEAGPEDSYAAVRASEAWEISKHIRGAVQRGSLVVAMGDFNMIPASREHALISSLSGLRDSWQVLHPDSAGGPVDDRQDPEAGKKRPVSGARFNVEVNGATVDGPFNTWRWPKERRKELGNGGMGKPVDEDEPDRKGKRIDFVFASTGNATGAGGHLGEMEAGWVVKSARVCMEQRHPVLGCSLSDHAAVETKLVWHVGGSGHGVPKDITFKDVSSAIHEQRHLDRQLLPTPNSNTTDGLAPIYDGILADTRKYMARERKQRRWREAHFSLSLLVAIGCYVAVWFSPRNFVAFILLLLSSLGLAAGVVDGLIGLLFMSSEIGALKEFEWEIENARVNLRPVEMKEEIMHSR